MLKMNDIKLELMTDFGRFLFIEKGMRGGILYIANKNTKSHNPEEPSNITCISMLTICMDGQ